MMMKASPAPALVVPEPDFLLELLVVALDPPACLGRGNQIRDGDVGRQTGEKVFAGLAFARRPFDQQPLLGPGLGAVGVAMCRADPHGGKARGERRTGALPPGHALPCIRGQALRQALGRDRLVLGITPQARGRTPAAGPALW